MLVPGPTLTNWCYVTEHELLQRIVSGVSVHRPIRFDLALDVQLINRISSTTTDSTTSYDYMQLASDR